MPDSPNPDTLPSAAHDATQLLRERIRAEVLAEVRRELRQSIPVRSIERPPRSRLERFRESKWTLAGVGSLIGAVASLLAVVMREPPPPAADPVLAKDVERLMVRTQDIRDTIAAQLHNENLRRRFEDSIFCDLGALPPGGCPDVRFHPRPLGHSQAQRIQPRIHVPPLPEPPE